jgi:hypothetical protein
VSDALTPFYGLTEPTPGGDTNTWGGLLNTNLVTIDKLLALPQPARHAGTLLTGTVTLDLAVSTIWTYTVVGTTTFAFSNVPTGTFASEVWLVLTNGGAGALTWPGSVTWLTGNAPNLKASGVNVLRFQTPDNGTTWYGSLLSQYAPVQTLYTNKGLSSVATSDGSLASYSLPASTLGVNGQAVRVTMVGRYVGAANGITYLKFGGTDLVNQTTGATSNAFFEIVAHISRTGATSQLAIWRETCATATPSGVTVAGSAAPAETLSGAVTIDFRGHNNASGTLFYDFVAVELVSTS